MDPPPTERGQAKKNGPLIKLIHPLISWSSITRPNNAAENIWAWRWCKIFEKDMDGNYFGVCEQENILWHSDYKIVEWYLKDQENI